LSCALLTVFPPDFIKFSRNLFLRIPRLSGCFSPPAQLEHNGIGPHFSPIRTVVVGWHQSNEQKIFSQSHLGSLPLQLKGVWRQIGHQSRSAPDA